MRCDLKRRELIVGGVAGLVAGGTVRGAGVHASVGGSGSGQGDAAASINKGQFLLGLNTSTIRGQKLSIVEEIELAKKAGYHAMEPWIDELERYAQSGGSLDDLAKRFRDAGITVESAIGFFDWVVDDPERRRKGFEAARRAMDLVSKIGGKRLAAPPVGIPIGGWPTCCRSPSDIGPCSSWATSVVLFPRSRSGGAPRR